MDKFKEYIPKKCKYCNVWCHNYSYMPYNEYYAREFVIKYKFINSRDNNSIIYNKITVNSSLFKAIIDKKEAYVCKKCRSKQLDNINKSSNITNKLRTRV